MKDLIEEPTHLNGHPVLATVEICPGGDGVTRQTRVVLVDRDPESKIPNMHGRYVTACHCENDPEWFWGHYFCTLAEAHDDFQSRIA